MHWLKCGARGLPSFKLRPSVSERHIRPMSYHELSWAFITRSSHFYHCGRYTVDYLM